MFENLQIPNFLKFPPSPYIRNYETLLRIVRLKLLWVRSHSVFKLLTIIVMLHLLFRSIIELNCFRGSQSLVHNLFPFRIVRVE